MGGDTGWQPLELTSDFVAYSTDSTPVYRKIGNIVNVGGAAKATATIDYTTEDVVIGTLPANCSPISPIITICQGSGVYIWQLRVNTNGTVAFSRYRNGSTTSSISTSTWLPFNVTFITSD